MKCQRLIVIKIPSKTIKSTVAVATKEEKTPLNNPPTKIVAIVIKKDNY